MKLVPVDPNDVPNYLAAGRGHVCYPILKQFTESAQLLCRLDRAGIPQSKDSVQSTLKSYAKKYRMPVKIFSRDGEIYLCRTDIDDKGNLLPAGSVEPKELTDDLIDEKTQQDNA